MVYYQLFLIVCYIVCYNLKLITSLSNIVWTANGWTLTRLYASASQEFKTVRWHPPVEYIKSHNQQVS